MPRDFESEKSTLDAMPSLAKEPARTTDADAGPGVSPPPNDPIPLYRLPSMMLDDRFKKMKDLHPYCSLLNQTDLDDCDWLEHAAFDPIEAATREKPIITLHITTTNPPLSKIRPSLTPSQIDYRLHTSSTLCSGIFTSAYRTTPGAPGTLARSRPFPSADSADSDRKKLLLGHIIATKHSASLVTDPSMDYPRDWRTNYQFSPASGVGHDELGETVCLHSLCVHPDFQGRGLGRVLLVGWTQRIKEAGGTKRVALICRERYVKWYEKVGFRNLGLSRCQYGGGGWFDMVLEFGEGKGGREEDF
ncbi:hypothetical protein B0J11DRAFT_590294 [Dendryphion nanum]|uniref:N-acetyltransferase domain-containing protein n=1 Tax=Dendryphion nanum TaxID=256645 RepID=A0A9P9DL84_9PLEO|nr:hypothetical protein B0J11DRAFT_590294 [Dendryphion nanum]